MSANATIEPSTIVKEAIASVEQGIAKAATEKAAAEKAVADRLVRARHELVAILIREDRPRKGDADQLASLIGELGWSTDDVKRELTKVRTVRKNNALLSESPARYERFRLARERLDEAEDRHKRELEELNHEANLASIAYSQTSDFTNTIATLARTDPHLFADGLLSLPAGISPPQQKLSENEWDRKSRDTQVQVRMAGRLTWVPAAIDRAGNLIRDRFNQFVPWFRAECPDAEEPRPMSREKQIKFNKANPQ